MLRLPVPIGKLVGNFNFVSADLLAARRIPGGFQGRIVVWKSLGPDVVDAIRKSTVMLIDMINNCHESLLLQALENVAAARMFPSKAALTAKAWAAQIQDV